MEFVKNFQEFISKQVDATVDLIFMNTHGYAMTTSGDITPEQQTKLDGIKEDLKQLVETQVIQNLDEKQRKFYGILLESEKLKVQVTPYDGDLGVSWKLMFGDETVEDGFDSTADAEMWARDNGYIPVSQEPRIWNVPVCRTGFGSRTIEVIATTEEEAIEKAIDEAGDYEFRENDADYTAPDGAF